MGFLTPWFLGGLALLAVPPLIHLTRRDRATPIPFPSLMFVRRVPQPTTAKRRLRAPPRPPPRPRAADPIPVADVRAARAAADDGQAPPARPAAAPAARARARAAGDGL